MKLKMKQIFVLALSLFLFFHTQAQLKKPTVPVKKETTAKPPVKVVERVKIVEKDNDRDGDGIIDVMDKCPDEWGELKNEGCPKQEINKISNSNKNEIINNFTLKMILIQGGLFNMGSNNGNFDEKPIHTVSISSFYMATTEVTQELWNLFMDINPSNFKGDNLPVENVSWIDCQTFILKLNKFTGNEYRLPTEAEWEFAAKGGIYGSFFNYSGSNFIDDVGWCDANSQNITHPVAQKAANKLGLFDMSGNVSEWCSDWLGNYKNYEETNPSGPSTGTYRAFRGGGYILNEQCCRVSRRSGDLPESRYFSLGFRLVRSIQ